MIDHLQIGAMQYRVKMVEDDQMIGVSSDGSGRAVSMNGSITYHNQTICMNVTCVPGEQLAVLWHEALHGILHQSGQDQNEKIVTCLGYGIIELIRKNPDLVRMTIEGV